MGGDDTTPTAEELAARPRVRYTVTVERTTTFIVAFTGPAGLDDADVQHEASWCIDHRYDGPARLVARDDAELRDSSRDLVRELQDDDKLAGPVTREPITETIAPSGGVL